MTELLLRMLVGVTLGLVLVLLLRRPARRVFGAGPAFTLWLLPIVLMVAPLLPQELAPAAMVVLPGLTVTPHAMAAASPAASFDWPDWLAALWTLGAVAGLLRLALHYVRLLRGLRAASDTWERMLTSAVPELDLDLRRVRIHAAGPAVLWALPRSLILLPDDFAERFATAATREPVLRHELAHVRRGDALWSLAMEIASALLWFHPLAWIGRARFRLDQELACDATSLRAMPQRTANYARALLHSVAVQPAPALIPWLAEPQLRERIAMLSRNPPGATRRRIGFVAVAAILAGGLYVAGGQTPVFAALQSSLATPSVDVTWKNAHPPHYPVEALRNGEQGLVVLDVTVDAHGQVSGVAVDPKDTTAPAILQEAAMDAAKDWRYAPGHEDGKAVGGVVRIPVNFSLTGIHPESAEGRSPSVDISYKNRNPPHYPVEALIKGEQGEVLLVITVDATGKVTDVAVDPTRTNAPEILQAAAMQAANNWRFNPGMKNGHAVGGKITVPVTFSLNPSWTSPHAEACPPGFRYKKGNGKSYACIASSPAKASS